MKGEMIMDLIETAIIVASKAHEGQYRKTTNIPYITHPYAVGMILQKAQYREEIIAAGILHDTVEDTNITLGEIEKIFGAEVANIVNGCSEPDKSLSWEDRKSHTIEYLKTASEDIRAVACADKIHNLKSILKDYQEVGDQVWERFNRGKQQQEWYYRNIVKSLGYSSTFELLEILQQEIDTLFGKE